MIKYRIAKTNAIKKAKFVGHGKTLLLPRGVWSEKMINRAFRRMEFQRQNRLVAKIFSQPLLKVA